MSNLLAEQCREHHYLYGKYSTCDLDCGAGEVVMETMEADREALDAGATPRIHCGACKGVHASVATVRFCCEVQHDFDRAAKRRQAMGY